MRRFAIALGAVVLLQGVAVVAQPKFVAPTRKHYDLKGKPAAAINNCSACHLKDRKSLNAYGKDLDAAMKKAKTKTITPDILALLDKLDSDKDGVTNGAEIKAGTNPGDASSK